MQNLAASHAPDTRSAVTQAPTTSLPAAVADAVLDAAIHASADLVYLEPTHGTDETYTVSVEREGAVLATATLEAGLGAAVIARLAYVADVDLTANRVATGAVKIRAPGFPARDLVLTVRPGTHLRAEAMIVARGSRPMRVGNLVHADLQRGDVVDHYRVVARLGEGGMGTVYQVEQAALGRSYALKVLHGHQLELGRTSVEQFLREARAAARLRHPHIVDVFDFGYLPDGRPYFVMELLDGTSVQQLVEAGPLKPHQAVTIGRQLADALAAAHEHGVVHADVSAGNVLVVNAGGSNVSAKLVDFGLAELRGPTPTPPTISDVVYGTPAYIAPEVARGQSADELSDQYSFGIILFELLTGRPPFNHEDVREVCRAHIFSELPPVVSPHGALPAELVAVVERCCAKSASSRYPTMRAVHTDLVRASRLVERRGWRKWLAA